MNNRRTYKEEEEEFSFGLILIGRATDYLPYFISYFHCGHRIDDQGFKDIIERAGKVKTVKRALYWYDWERYSNRQKTRMKLGGFMGEITYEGDFGPFWPYIRLGEPG